MPTNLPDPRNWKTDENRETFLTALFVVVRVAMARTRDRMPSDGTMGGLIGKLDVLRVLGPGVTVMPDLVDPKGPFMDNSRRRGPRYNRPYEDEPGVIGQFRLVRIRLDSKPSGMTKPENWRFGKRVADACTLLPPRGDEWPPKLALT
jgi:hypothetical protein